MTKYAHDAIDMFDNQHVDYPKKLHNLLEYLVPYLLKNDYTVRFNDMPKQKLLTRGQLSQSSQAAVQQAAATQHQLVLQSGVMPESQPQLQSHMQHPQEVKHQPQDMVQQTVQKAAKPKLSPLECAEVMVGEKLSIRPHRSRRYVCKEFEKRH